MGTAAAWRPATDAETRQENWQVTKMGKNPQSPKAKRPAGRQQESVAATGPEEEEAVLAEPNIRIAVVIEEAVAEKVS